MTVWAAGGRGCPLGAPGILVLSVEVACNQGIFYVSHATQINNNDE